MHQQQKGRVILLETVIDLWRQLDSFECSHLSTERTCGSRSLNSVSGASAQRIYLCLERSGT